MKRRGIGAALVTILGMIVIVGIVWIGSYYGAILPISNTLSVQFGAGIYDSNILAFVLTVCAFWVLILTFGAIWWLWQQSQKRSPYYE
ncbi:MAG: hypothetical protein OK436_01615 [Thaumarchaeota archaeon]|nr:hypothetical protein [Nitrososphaerota archaeon]